MTPRRVQLLAVVGASLAVFACDNTTDPNSVPETPSAEPALAIASNSWIARAPMPGDYRWGLTSAVVPNSAGQSILYAMGGSFASFPQPSGPTTGTRATVQAYNAATNTWSNRAPMPLALYRTNGAGVINGKIYISGGRLRGDKNYQATLLVYDPAKNTWSRKRDMPAQTWGGVTGVIDKKLYVLTCELEEDCFPESRLALYRYDPATNQWTFLSVTPRPLGEPMGGVIGGKLYAVGGSWRRVGGV
jgi:N-acetylneuraminic acid mutarotase